MDDFDIFFASHYQPILESLALASGDRVGAEDAAQEAFARALVRWRRVKHLDRPATWVFVVAVRELRRRQRRDTRVSSLGVATASVPDPAGALATSAWIEQAVRDLSPRQRLAVALRFHADLPVKDVAAVMGCSEGTVKSTLHAALSRLRTELADPQMGEIHDGR